MATTPIATSPISRYVPLRSRKVFWAGRREAGRRAVVRRELAGVVGTPDDAPEDAPEDAPDEAPDGAADAGRVRDRLATVRGLSRCRKGQDLVAAGGDGRAATHKRLRHKPLLRPKAG